MTRSNLPQRDQSGLSIIELMIALVLGMLVILATTVLVIASKSTEAAQNDATVMRDTARFALDNIARSVRQAGYVTYGDPSVPVISQKQMTPAIMGLDASTVAATSYGIDLPKKSNNHSSDILVVRFFGSGSGAADGSMLNCAGFGVPAPTSQSGAELERGWSIYYVANDRHGEPHLYCKYRDTHFTAQSIAQGVESFQVLYGLDTSNPPDGVANQYLTATEINQLDADLPPHDVNRLSHWQKVVAVKVALLIRGTGHSRADRTPATYYLFGENYGKTKGHADPGTVISESALADTQTTPLTQLRRVYSATIPLKNASQ